MSKYPFTVSTGGGDIMRLSFERGGNIWAMNMRLLGNYNTIIVLDNNVFSVPDGHSNDRSISLKLKELSAYSTPFPANKQGMLEIFVLATEAVDSHLEYTKKHEAKAAAVAAKATKLAAEFD